jgi:tRNA nucleotidyltransferase (CCA-adding enzyme)
MLEALKFTPQDSVFHPEGDVEKHSELCLKQTERIINDNLITSKEKIVLVMALLLHDIAKPLCTEEMMKNNRMTITSHGHEEMGGVMSKDFLGSIGFHEDLVIPISNLISNHLAGINISLITAPSGRIKYVKKLSKKLFPATIQQLLHVMDADINGRGFEELKESTGRKEISDVAKDLDIVTKQYEYLLMGRHLIEQGLKPSATFGTILKVSYEAQENGEFDDVEGAKKWLDECLKMWDKKEM